VGRLAAWLAHVPVIVHTAHGFAFHERSSILARLSYSTLERIASCCCDRIISVSQFHRRWALELGICDPSHILTIANGVAPASGNPSIAPAEMRRRWGVRDDDFFILSTARLASDKGLEYLIQAAANFPCVERRYRVVIAGDGPLRPRLERLARSLGVGDRVVFLGYREDVADLLAACDLVVLPSLREGLSMALLDAMAAGKPIVATSIGSHLELALQAEIARLVPPASPEALCEAILGLARDPALMARLGKTAHALFESSYTEDRMLNSYKQLYADLLEKKSLAGATVAGPGYHVRHAEPRERV
jgi:glycosyltransferase involved in cell wall biosynthesis